jgi:hypothetical protein
MAQPRSERTHARPRPRTNWPIWALIAVLLAAVLAGTIWVPIYNRTTPALGSFPFFYWYQLLWVPVVALVSWCAYALSRRAQRGTRPTPSGPATGGPAPGGPGGPASRGAGPPPLPKRKIPRRPEAN